MVRIRLKRLGRKKRPFYRIVVTDKRARRDCAPLQELGYYNPLTKELKLDKEGAQAWVAKGASPSETVEYLMSKAPDSGELIMLEKKQKTKLSKKAKAKQAEEAEAKKQEAETAKAKKEEEAAKPEEPKAEEAPAAEDTKAEEKKEEAKPEEAKEEPKAEEKATA